MQISEVCIKRPVFAWVLTLIVIILGIVTGDRLPVQQYPKMEKNKLTVKINYYGAGPEIIENQVTRVVEEAVAGIEGIETIESKSDSENSEVTLEISEGRNIDSAANDVRDRLSKWDDRFPDAAQSPILTKAGSGEKPIMSLALISENMNESELYTYAKNEISHSLESVPGVARVDVYGAGDYQMAVCLDPQKLAFYNLTVLDVINALKKQNIESPAGKFVNKDREYVVTTVADLQSPEEFNELPVVNKKNKIIKLKDVGEAKLDKSNKKVLSRFNGQRVVTLQVVVQSSANPIQIAHDIKKKHKELRENIPDDIKFLVSYDTTTFIERSLNEVYRTIIEAILLVVLVVFIFLRSLRAAFIPLVTIPVSLIGALFIMYLCGFTLNSMTLMSMVLAIGLVVDDAIVILENVYKYIEKGLNPIKAAIEGTKEVSFAVIAMTLTLCAVYAPVALAKGLTGKLLKEFSITLAGAVLLSGFIALTLSPMMCSRMLMSEEEEEKRKHQQSTIVRKLSSLFDFSNTINNIEKGYEKLLDSALSHRFKIVMAALAFSVVGYSVYYFMPREQLPYQDTGVFGYEGHAPQTATLQFTQRYVNEVDKIVRSIPEVENTEFDITNPTFDGVVILKERCGKTTEQVIKEIEEKAKNVSGIDIRFSAGRGSGEDNSKIVYFVVRGNKSHRELRDITSNLISAIYASGIVRGMRSTSRNEAEDYIIEIMRDKALAMNLDPKSISDTISGLLQGSVATRFKKDNKVYDVKVQIDEQYKKAPNQLNDIFVKAYTNSDELLVPISEIINVTARSGPISVHRYNRARANTVLALLNDDSSLGEAINVIKDVAKQTLPNDVHIEFIGDTKRFLSESNTMALIFFLALSFIYLVMAAQFESWKDPFIIMFTVPLALVGGILSLTLVKNGTINMFSNIGFLTLIGLITKHGILMVDFANKQVDEGKTPMEAIKISACRRLRPILMTTLAMALGSLPLAMAKGAGCEIRRPLGMVIVGGISIGTIFTIFVVPVIYTYFNKSRRRKKYIEANS
ncbi:MAG: efflux RND transporter permease subunit [Alphaproteobacteria bacterium]|nr:efflux RND transporter permease subunit [Alphaproteobacteria bacterium]